MLLLLYRRLTQTLAPLVAIYLRRRQRQGKEDALRFQERRGIPSLAAAPFGPATFPLLSARAASIISFS